MRFGKVAVLLGLLGGSASAAPAPVVHPNPSNSCGQVVQQPSASEAVKAYFGTIERDGDKFVLRDEARKIWYELDDQQTVGKFGGKKVKITGTLDVTKNLIRVQSIEEAST
jgi:uncharacterized protein YdeI (BOF family)